MNEISVKQNEPELLRYQFGARYCYDRADSLNKLVFSLLVVILLLDISFYYFNINILIQLILTIIIIIIQFFANRYISKYIKTGVYYKSRFDYSLFEMELPVYKHKKKYEEFLIKLEKENWDKFNTQISNNGEDIPPGVKDWYFNVESSATLNEAILFCMNQNIDFSEKISTESLKTLATTFVFITFLGVLLLHNNNTLFIVTFIQFASILLQVGIFISSELKYLLKIHEIKCNMEFNVTLNTSHLVKIQGNTDDYRSINRITSKNFHLKNSKKMHEIINEIKTRDF